MNRAITVPLSDDEVARIDALAAGRGITRDEMLRVCLLGGLGAAEELQAELSATDEPGGHR